MANHKWATKQWMRKSSTFPFFEFTWGCKGGTAPNKEDKWEKDHKRKIKSNSGSTKDRRLDKCRNNRDQQLPSKIRQSLHYSSHVLALVLCKGQLCFTRFPRAIGREGSRTVWRATPDGLHLEHASSKGVPNRNIKHTMVGELCNCRPTAKEELKVEKHSRW